MQAGPTSRENRLKSDGHGTGVPGYFIQAGHLIHMPAVLNFVIDRPSVFEGRGVTEARPRGCCVAHRLAAFGLTVRAIRGAGPRPFDRNSEGLDVARVSRGMMDWCGREDSNFHEVAPTSTSSLRVYHSATTAPW